MRSNGRRVIRENNRNGRNMNLIELNKALSPRQKFLGFIVVALISGITSLGTAYMSGSDCTEISEKYVKSIENYNKLIDVTDQTQQKYMDAKNDILIIQERLIAVMDIINSKEGSISNSYTLASTTDRLETQIIDTVGGVLAMHRPPVNYIREEIIVTKNHTPTTAKTAIDSLIQITHKYDEK